MHLTHEGASHFNPPVVNFTRQDKSLCGMISFFLKEFYNVKFESLTGEPLRAVAEVK